MIQLILFHLTLALSSNFGLNQSEEQPQSQPLARETELFSWVNLLGLLRLYGKG